MIVLFVGSIDERDAQEWRPLQQCLTDRDGSRPSRASVIGGRSVKWMHNRKDPRAKGLAL